LRTDGAPLFTAQSKLSVRLATADEAIIFGHAANLAKPSDDMVLAYLVELDVRKTISRENDAERVFNSPTQWKVAFIARGRSKRVPAMTHKAITLKFVALTVLAIALGIMISIGAAHLTDKHSAPIDRHALAGSREIAELPNPDGRLSRVRLLLSR
jgi:hypothetical protein